MPIYTAEAVRSDPTTGEITIVRVTINDADQVITSEETGVEYQVDGVSLGADAPVIERGNLNVDLADGTTETQIVEYFTDGTYDYYIPVLDRASSAITAINSYATSFVATYLTYSQSGIHDEDANLYVGEALTIAEDGGGAVLSTSVKEFFIWDDDETSELDGDGTGAASETGNFAIGIANGHRMPVDVDTTDNGSGDTQHVLVSIDVDTTAGTATFYAMKFTKVFGGVTYTYYLQYGSAVDLPTVTAVTAETLYSNDGDGIDYADFGLTTGTIAYTGTSGDDALVMNFYHDEVNGGAGADIIYGENGDDTLNGEAGADILNGGEGNDTLNGGTENDVLDGGLGDDILDGGDGSDTLNGGAGNDILTGGALTDTLNGGAGDDTLSGGYGTDTLDGGDGQDMASYYGFGGTVTVTLLNAGVAQVTGPAGTDTLISIESLSGGAYNDTLTGSTGSNVLLGLDGSDFLFGLGGSDSISGGSGNDNIQGGNGNDTLYGANGLDTILGGAGVDFLAGNDGNDQLRGGDDADTLTGGDGRDVLIGGDFSGGGFPGDGAADTFVFTSVSDSAAGGATRDIIRDYEVGLDVMDLSGIDAIAGGGDDAFSYVGAAAFTGSAGELRAFNVGANTVLRGDVDGDGAADFEVFLNGTLALTGADFIL